MATKIRSDFELGGSNLVTMVTIFGLFVFVTIYCLPLLLFW